MPIDPSIPLADNPPPDFLTQQRGIVSLRDMAMRLRQQQAAEQAQNALRQIFANPANLDTKTGFPTSNAMNRIMAIDPNMGLQLRQNQLRSEQLNLSIAGQKSDIQKKLSSMSEDMVRGPSLIAYEDAKKAGLSEQDAQAAGQRAYSEGLQQLRSSGLASDDQLAMVPSDFNYQRVKSRSMQYKDYLAQQQKGTPEAQILDKYRKEHPGATAEQEGAFLSGIKKEEKGSSDIGWVVLTDPTNKDKEGNPTQYRYNPRTAQATTLGGQPYTPGGASKLGAGDMSTIADEDKKYWAEVLRRGGTLPPGLARTAAGSRLVQEIMKEVPKGSTPGGLIASEASVKADRTSLSNLTKMTDAATSFESTAAKNFDLALSLAPKAIPTDWGPWLNRWIMQGETALGNKDVPPYVTAMLTGANEYAKIMSGSTGAQGSTVDSRREAAELFSPYLSKGQIGEVIKVAKADMSNRKNALNEQIDTIKGRLGKTEEKPSSAGPDIKKMATDAWGAYEPDKYEYRVSPEGKLQRRAK